MIKANKRGRPCVPPEVRSLQIEAQQLLINLIDIGSGLNASALEEIFHLGAQGVKQKTGRTWYRWKAGERAMSRDQRDRIGRLAIKRGWLPQVGANTLFGTDAESIAFNSLRGYAPRHGLTFDRADELAMRESRQARSRVEKWVKQNELKFARAKARAITAIADLQSIYQSTELDLPLAPPENIKSAHLHSMAEQLQEMELDFFFEPYWNV